VRDASGAALFPVFLRGAACGWRLRQLPGKDKWSGAEFATQVPRFSCRNHKRSLGLGEDGMTHPLGSGA
jgi:hypothetical protein